nr:hypothetical protein [Tanacetum cinerariifolium]
ISSGSTTAHSDISLSEYDSFNFDLSNDQCPPFDRSDLTHEEFTDELTHIISPPEYDCFYFRDLPDPGELISSLNFGIRENLSSTTCVYLPVEDDHSPLLAYVVWIFLAYLMYPVIPPYLHPFRNEDTIFDPDITINRFYSFKPGLSNRCGAFKKFNTHRSHLNECPMIINGKNTHILDVPLFHFYPLINSNSCQRILSSKSSFPHLQLGINSQPMLKSAYKAEDGVIISIPPLVRGVADVVVEIKADKAGTFREERSLHGIISPMRTLISENLCALSCILSESVFASPVIHPPPQETSIEILHDQQNVINAAQTFLRKFNRYSFFETPKVFLLAWDRVFEIKDALGNKQYKPKDTQELFCKLLNDVQIIHEELAEYINTPGWDRPTLYDDDDDDDDVDYTIAITPVLSTEEPNNSLSMGDEHLDTIPATESDEIIKSSVKDLVPIPSEFEGIPDTMCDAHLVKNPTPLEAKDHFEIALNSNDDISSS